MGLPRLNDAYTVASLSGNRFGNAGDGELYCPVCGAVRRMSVSRLHWEDRAISYNGGESAEEIRDIHLRAQAPLLYQYTCLQCQTEFTALVYIGSAGPSIAVFCARAGGVATPNSPASVSHYLDQAYRSHSVGANSAAVAMYRAALEQLLFEQGFVKGMLKQKIDDLEAAAKADPRRWIRDLHPDYLRVMKDLGNGSIHPNGGDITKQAALDADLVAEVEVTFHALLDAVYEAPQREVARLAKLKSAAKVVT